MHPLLTHTLPVGLISGENPRFPSAPGGHEGLKRDLDDLGVQHEETFGHYGSPERSFLVYGLPREHLTQLGKKYGQEAVIHSEGGKRHFIYTGGEREGQAHEGLPTHEHWPEGAPPPDDNYTKLPGAGYVRLHFNFGEHMPLQKVEGRPNLTSQELLAVADDKELTLPEALRELHGGLKAQVTEWEQSCLDLRKAETAALEKVAPPGREEQVKELKGKVNNPYAVAWSSYNKGHEKGYHKKAEDLNAYAKAELAAKKEAKDHKPAPAVCAAPMCTKKVTGSAEYCREHKKYPPSEAVKKAYAAKGEMDKGEPSIKVKVKIKGLGGEHEEKVAKAQDEGLAAGYSEPEPHEPVHKDEAAAQTSASSASGGMGQAGSAPAPNLGEMAMGEDDAKLDAYAKNLGDPGAYGPGGGSMPAGGMGMSKAEMCKMCGYEHEGGKHLEKDEDKHLDSYAKGELAMAKDKDAPNRPKIAESTSLPPGANATSPGPKPGVVPTDKAPKKSPPQAEGSGGQIKKAALQTSAPPAMGAAAATPMPKPPKLPGMSGGAGAGGPKLPKPGAPATPKTPAMGAGQPALKAELVPGQTLDIKPMASSPVKPGPMATGGAPKLPGVGAKPVQTMAERVASKLTPPTAEARGAAPTNYGTQRAMALTGAAPALPGAHLFGKGPK